MKFFLENFQTCPKPSDWNGKLITNDSDYKNYMGTISGEHYEYYEFDNNIYAVSNENKKPF